MAVPRTTSDLRIKPDSHQSEAIEHVGGPMLVLAGAGTGKTTVLIRRIANLVRQGHARPDEILALTYTDNAAKEMAQRIERELGKAGADVQVSTFHAYCNNLLIRSKGDFGVLLDRDLWVLLRRNLKDLQLKYYVRAADTAKFLDDLIEFMRRCQDELVGPQQYADYVHRIEQGEIPIPRVIKSKDANEITEEEALGRCREVAAVFETVERMLTERKLGTFGHMIVRAHELLIENPTFLEQERARAKFILVDEFQDANFAQIKILSKLAGENERATQANIFAVGDPDQGIYRFRGASSGAFELFRKYFPESKLTVLAKNHRSTTPILKCAYALITENPAFELGAAGKYSRSPLSSARDEQEPQKAAQRQLVDAVLVSGAFMEATDAVSSLVERKKKSRCDWKDIAVLYRSHSHRDELVAELARNGIPFSIEGVDVMEAPEIRDLRACVGAVVSPTNGASWFRVAALRQFSVDPNELRSAMKGLPRESRGAVASVLRNVQGGAEVLNAVEHAREQIAGKKIRAAMIALTGYFQLPRKPSIEAMLQFVNRWEQSAIAEGGSPAEFLDYLDYYREGRGTIPLPSSEHENSVKLMTAHSAKGLEFDHVFILRAVKGSFPTYYREPLIEIPAELRNSGIADQDEKKICDQEERRLFYVAMTRARDTLAIYGQFGRGKAEKTPAGYLRELIKHKELKQSLAQRTCRDFQTDIFGEQELPTSSRLAEWVALPPASDLAANLSPSAIQTYEMCPLQFKLEREWRIPVEVSAAPQYGAAMHRVLLSYYDSVRWGRPLTEAGLIEQLRSDLADAGFADHYQRELYEQKGIEEIKEFIASAGQGKIEVLHTEEKFSMKISATNLVGRIDRIDRASSNNSGDKVVITDYKTGRPKTQEDADKSLQLSLYALAAREQWGYHAERLVFHNLEGNTTVGSHRTELQLDTAKLQVEEIARKIAAGNFDAKPGIYCNFCGYRLLCPKTEKRIPEIRAAAALKPGN
jgi:DNA helicase-2/ATP-dependent DNA helicase PcrA